MTIQVEVFETADEAAVRVADLIQNQIKAASSCQLGLATGSTPLPVYASLRQRVQDGGLSFQGVTTFNLDEYLGLPAEHPQSYRQYMQKHLFEGVDVQADRTHLPITSANDHERSCSDYEVLLNNCGGIDLQLLGIGTNGHIGFNEPGSAIDSRTRVVDLAESTVVSNSRFFDSIDDVPTQAITMGIGTILEAKQIVLMADGSSKADAIAQAIHGEVSSSNPASFLQTHACVTFVLDQDAARHVDKDALRSSG